VQLGNRFGGSPGITAGLNYYGLTRPLVQNANAFQALRQGQLGSFSGADVTGEQPVYTGHAFGFQNQSIFYQNQYSFGSFGGNVNRSPGQGLSTFGNRPGGQAGSSNFGAVPPPRQR
jgi:hypothetical protein